MISIRDIGLQEPIGERGRYWGWREAGEAGEGRASCLVGARTHVCCPGQEPLRVIGWRGRGLQYASPGVVSWGQI